MTNLPSYQRVCRAANDRYLNALSVVNDPTPAYQQVADLTESKTHRGRRYAGFNPARKDDVRLFQACSPVLTNYAASTTATSVNHCMGWFVIRLNVVAAPTPCHDCSNACMSEASSPESPEHVAGESLNEGIHFSAP